MMLAAIVVLAGLLFLLPFLDRSAERRPTRRFGVLAAFGVGLFGIAVLTSLGLRDSPNNPDAAHWAPLSIARFEVAQDQRCLTCHKTGGAANPIKETVARRDPDWLVGHVRDPQMISPGLREIPSGSLNEGQARSVVAYMKRVRAGSTEPPAVSPADRAGAVVYGRYCSTCHAIDGEGAKEAPDLSKVGEKRDAKWLREWITDPMAVQFDATMPAFGERLSEEQMNTIVNYLAARK